MLKNPLIFIALAWTLLAQSALLKADAQPPRAVLDSVAKNFGKVNQGTVVSRDFILQNDGHSPLEIQRIEVSAPGMKVRAKQQIPSGSSTKVQINWDTSRFIGKVEEQALLYINDPDQPKILLTLKGSIIPPIDILPVPAFYLSQYKGEKKARNLIIQNNQIHDIEITKLESPGSHFIPHFETVEAGRTYRLWVKVSPATPAGRYREAITIHTDDPNNARINVEVNILVKEDIHITPKQADFGAIKLSQVQLKPGLAELTRQTLIIKRRQGAMEITGIESDIPFLNINTTPTGQSEGFSLGVALDYSQTTPGPFKGIIVLRTDDAEYPELEIPVMGVIWE